MASTRVTRWADVLEQARDDIGAHKLPLAVLLALVATESSGDDYADNGTFRGLLQIANPYLEDARAWIAKHRPELLHKIPEHKDDLLGNARASALVVCAYMMRYASRHQWTPHRIAAIHKGGAGSARVVRNLIRSGHDEKSAIRWVSRNYRWTKGRRRGRLRLPKIYAYAYGRRHFGGHIKRYLAWVSKERAPSAPMTALAVASSQVAPGWPQRLAEFLFTFIASRFSRV